MNLVSQNINFEKSGYYLSGLLIIAALGFWPSYFSKFFDGTADFNFYFHFHAVIAVLWLLLLITQPILIHKKKASLHRFLGKFSYVLVPLIFISVILLAHNRITGTENSLGLSLWVPFKDLLILGVAFFIAIKYRHKMPIHARGMIGAGIVFLEPALVRFISNTFFSEPGPAGYLVTLAIVYTLLIGFIVAERKQQQGRWVFPLIMGLYVFVHAVILLRIEISPWQAFAEWFASLPLT